MTHDAWWLQLDGRLHGPKTSLELRQLVQESELTPDTPISPDQKQWLPAAKVRGLFPAAAPDGAGPVVRNAAGKPFDVFISYSSFDKELADAACSVLEGQRIRCWIAPRDMIPGAEWGETIIRGIESSAMMLLIFSARANDSPQVRREVERAVGKGMAILPFRIEDVRPAGAMEYALFNTSWLDGFTPPVERHLNSLAKSILTLLGLNAEAVVKKPPDVTDSSASVPTISLAPPKRRWPILAAGTALIVRLAKSIRRLLVLNAQAVVKTSAPATKSSASSPIVSPREPKRRWPMLVAGVAVIALLATISLIIFSPNKIDNGQVTNKGPKPGEEREFDVGNGVKMIFCWIPGANGKATLGSPNTETGHLEDETKHEVELDGFWMAKYPMTQAQYVKLSGKANPSCFRADGDGKDSVHGLNTADFPVENVSWNEAQECIKSIKAPRGMTASLPSEAQWEWAARGGRGNARPFYWGDVLNGDKANCDGTAPYGTATPGAYLKRTERVGSYENAAPHPWGLCDMAGNVYQWCEDYYGDYAQLPRGKNPVQTVKHSDERRVLRGGSWLDTSEVCRSAYRYYLAPVIRYNYIGLRVVFALL